MEEFLIHIKCHLLLVGATPYSYRSNLSSQNPKHLRLFSNIHNLTPDFCISGSFLHQTRLRTIEIPMIDAKLT